jgi:hypothetical protein
LLLQKAQADQGAPQEQKGFMNVGPLLIANTQAAKLVQPSERAFHHPSPSSKPAAMFGVPSSKEGDDISSTQASPDGFGSISAISCYAVRPMPRTAALALQFRNCVNQRERLLRIVAIGPG